MESYDVTEAASTSGDGMAVWAVALICISALLFVAVVAIVALCLFFWKSRAKNPPSQQTERRFSMPHPEDCNPPATPTSDPIDPISESQTPVHMDTVMTRDRDSGFADGRSSSGSSGLDRTSTVSPYLDMNGKKPPRPHTYVNMGLEASKKDDDYLTPTGSEDPSNMDKEFQKFYPPKSHTASCPALNQTLTGDYVRMDSGEDPKGYENRVNPSKNSSNDYENPINKKSAPSLPPKTSAKVKVNKEGLPPTIKMPKKREPAALYKME